MFYGDEDEEGEEDLNDDDSDKDEKAGKPVAKDTVALA